MFVSVEPGFEDLELMAYYRLYRGASIVSVYVTNGESGAGDSDALMPLSLASSKRKEAHRAVLYLGGETRFLNLPELAAASDGKKVSQLWKADSLKRKFEGLILWFNPDIIVLCRDYSCSEGAFRKRYLTSELSSVVRLLARSDRKPSVGGMTKPSWSVSLMIDDDGSGSGLRIPQMPPHEWWKKTLGTVATEAENHYVSMKVQHQMMREAKARAYKVVYGSDLKKTTSLEQELPSPEIVKVRKIRDAISSIAQKVLKEKQDAIARSRLDEYLRELVAIDKDIEATALRMSSATPLEKRTMISWKEALAELRHALMGVQLFARLSEEILVEKQVVFLHIDSVKGIDQSQVAELYFPYIQAGWYVNEKTTTRYPLKIGEAFRVLSPTTVPYDLPDDVYGLDKSMAFNRFSVYLTQKGSEEGRNIRYRKEFELLYAPRYSVETIPHIVRAGYTKTIDVRFTNHTRDGVRDTIRIVDSLAVSDPKPFRASSKGANDQVRVDLKWSDSVKEGTWIIPVSIAGVKTGKFAARSFRSSILTGKTVGLVPALPSSKTIDAFVNVGVQPRIIRLDSGIHAELSSLDVLVLDERVLTLQPETGKRVSDFIQFAVNGGHLIVLAQDAASWNKTPLIRGLTLEQSSKFDLSLNVAADSTDNVIKGPNRIGAEAWQGWIYRRAWNKVSLKTNADVVAPVRIGKSKNAAVVRESIGKGTITYVDLDLLHQWMNIHPGALRLLANLLSS